MQPVHLFLFVIRVPLLLTAFIAYFTVLCWLPIGSLGKKAWLWIMLGIPGIWWIDLQIDGVRRGSLAKQTAARLPQPGSVIASSFTSPIDSLYLAAIFDPIFTASYPYTRNVQRITLFEAMLRALYPPAATPPSNAKLVPLKQILAENPDSCVVVFPECTTTNNRGILPLSPSLLTTPPTAKIFPVSLRYNAPDITTPVPGSYFSFLWILNSKPTHCIRVRIAEAVYNKSAKLSAPVSSTTSATVTPNSYDTNFFDSIGSERDTRMSDADTLIDDEDALEPEEKKLLDKVAEDLARLGRVKRVGLGVKEKEEFVRAWAKRRVR